MSPHSDYSEDDSMGEFIELITTKGGVQYLDGYFLVVIRGAEEVRRRNIGPTIEVRTQDMVQTIFIWRKWHVLGVQPPPRMGHLQQCC